MPTARSYEEKKKRTTIYKSQRPFPCITVLNFYFPSFFHNLFHYQLPPRFPLQPLQLFFSFPVTSSVPPSHRQPLDDTIIKVALRFIPPTANDVFFFSGAAPLKQKRPPNKNKTKRSDSNKWAKRKRSVFFSSWISVFVIGLHLPILTSLAPSLLYLKDRRHPTQPVCIIITNNIFFCAGTSTHLLS